MTSLRLLAGAGALAVVLATPTSVPAQDSITTPDKVETRIGALEFKNGVASKQTLVKI